MCGVSEVLSICFGVAGAVTRMPVPGRGPATQLQFSVAAVDARTHSLSIIAMMVSVFL